MSATNNVTVLPIRPELVNKSQPYTLFSIVGEHYAIKSVDKKVAIAVHRGFNETSLRSFLRETRKTRRPRSYFPFPAHSPLVITNDPRNLENVEYQQSVLSKVFLGIDDGKDVDEFNDETKSDIDDEKVDLEKIKSDVESKTSVQDISMAPAEQGKLDNFKLSDYEKESRPAISDDLPVDNSLVGDEETKLSEEEMEKLEEIKAKNNKIASEVFKMPSNFKTAEKYALMQFISCSADGKKLDEPIVISRGFFESKGTVNDYREKFIKLMSRYHSKHFVSRLDLVMVPVDTLGSPWYDRNLVKKNLKFGGETIVKDKEKNQITEFLNDAAVYSEELSKKGKTTATDPKDFLTLDAVYRTDGENYKVDEDAKPVKISSQLFSQNSGRPPEVGKGVEKKKSESSKTLTMEELMSCADTVPDFLLDSSNHKIFSGKSIIK